MRFVIHPHRQVSTKQAHSRERIRQFARSVNVPRGRNTDDTVRNLIAAGYTNWAELI